ncbi:hypothetical protein RCL_jg21425.t1 [Rhizophagus clarus]|uniref:Uncharacterized protein n=1 Tax=Rhizophagus clarus TaxID=94130 RepID=A0A8H3LRQ6_9GLOM|nr:hypothetical protein RCL_jg21425.t1 [Rhizophagus clarus]
MVALRYMEPKTELSKDTINILKIDLYSLLQSLSEKVFAHKISCDDGNQNIVSLGTIYPHEDERKKTIVVQ